MPRGRSRAAGRPVYRPARGSDHELPVFLEQLAVHLDAAAAAQVADHVVVDRALVLARRVSG